MKNDLIVQRAKKVITDLGLLNRIGYIKEYTNVLKEDRYSENYLLKYILNLAEDQQQMNYLFVEKVLKQINLLLL
jgi:hypothetical protein